VASVCLLGAWLPHAVAQTPVTVEDVLRANERNIRDAQQRKVPEADVFLQDKISPPEKSEPRALDTEGCLPVVQYELAGLASSMPAPPQELLARYTGPCIGAQQLNDLLGELNAWFQAQGLITTRAYIEAQKKPTERLQVRVIPGRIEKITINGSDQDPRIAYAFPALTQGLLNLRDLEQGLENINRLPSQQGTFKLYPGQEPGSSEVRVDIQDSPRARLSQMIDNSGTPSLGKWKSTTELAFDNLAVRNDQLAIGLLKNLDNGDLDALFQGVTFNYLLPVGYHLWSTSVSWIDTQFTLPGINTTYPLQTQAQKVGVGYEYLYSRDQQSKQSLLLGVDVSRQKTEVQNIEIQSQTRRLTVAYA
jgi:hemolysin activation/secretion protein